MEESHKKLIANYEVTETVFESAEGFLYKATDATSSDSVLIKVYFPSLTWSDDLLSKFFDRFSYLRFIEHANLLPILDMGKHENAPYVVYPYFSNESLEAQAFQQRPEKEILRVFYEIVDALDFLHKQEILHGTLSAENVLIDPTGSPKLFDYGLTEIFKKLLLENTEDGFYNFSVSKVDTISPEQLLGHSPTRQSDIYAFGMLLFFCLFGTYPFKSKLVPEIAAWHLDPGITKISLEFPKASKQTFRLIQKCIQVKPENRFSSFSEVLRILDRIKKGKRTSFPFQKRLELVKSARSRLIWWYAIPAAILLGLASWIYIQKSLSQAAPPEFASIPDRAATSTTVPSMTATATSTLPPMEPTTTPSSAASSEVTEPTPVQAHTYQPAIEGEQPVSLKEKISLRNVQMVREISRLGYGRPEDANISQRNKYFAIASSGGVVIYQGINRKTWIDPQGWATAVQFSPDEKTLAIGLESGDIQLWDWSNGVKTSTLSGHSGEISKILFSSNGRFIYSASFDQHAIIWNAASQSIVQDIAAHSDPINDIVVSSDGRTLATASDDQLVRVWDLAVGTKTYEIRYPGKLKALALSSDDTYLAIGGEAGFVWQINIRTRQLRTDPIPVTKRVWSLQYIESDRKLLVGIDNGQSKIYDASQIHHEGISLAFKIEPFPLPLVKIFGFDFLFDSFAASSGNQNGVLTFRWDGMVNYDQIKILEPFYDSQDRLDFSEDGSVLAASGKYEITSVWDIENNRVLYRDHVRLPQGDPISPDGKHIVVETQSVYQLVDLTTGAMNRSFSEKVAGGVISYAKQGSILVSGNLREARVWDYASSYKTFFSSHPENGCLVTRSANNQEVLQVNSAPGVVPVWQEDTKRFCAKSFLYINSISAFSTNMDRFVYRNSSGLVEGFDLVDNQVLWRYPSEGKPTSKIITLTVSSDGSIVAIGNENGELLLLDGKNGKLLTTLIGNFGAVQAVKFSADDMKLATVGFDGMIRIFGVIK